MTKENWVSLLSLFVSAVSLILSFVVYWYAHRARTLSAQAQIELMVAAQILGARQRYLERLERQLERLSSSSASPEMNDLQTKLVREAAAAYCNAIEVICSLYLDNKIDRTRIKKSYGATIIELVKGDDFAEFYTKPRSNLNATLKVFEELDHGTESR
jgi:hypothetical protein